MKKILLSVLATALIGCADRVPRETITAEYAEFRDGNRNIHIFYNGIHYIKFSYSTTFINYTADSLYNEYNLQQEVDYNIRRQLNESYPFDHSGILINSK